MSFLFFLAIMAASFIYVGAKAFQQLNVVHGNKRMVPVATLVMAVCEVVVMGNIAVQVVSGDLWAMVLTICAMTIGSTNGCLASMWAHAKMRNRSPR